MVEVKMAEGRDSLLVFHDKIDPNDIQNSQVAHETIQIVRPDWEWADVSFEACGMGFINCVIKASTPGPSDPVVFRITPETEFASTMDKEQEAVITRLLHEVGIGPRLNCLFKNGACFDFVHGETYQWTDLSALDDIRITKSAVRELACYHCNRTKSLAISPAHRLKEVNNFRNFIKPLLDMYPKSFTVGEESEVNGLLSRLPSESKLRAETEEAVDLIERMGSPLVVCHHDVNPTNIIYDPETEKATVLDYDVCGFGYAAYDLAYVLVSQCCGSKFATPSNKRSHPNYRKAVLHEYLKTKRKLDGDDSVVETSDVDELYIQVTKASLSVKLFYVLLYIIDTNLPTLPYGTPLGFLRMADELYASYRKDKEDILKL